MGYRRKPLGVLLQVRLDSTRLPRKALLELCGKTVIEHAMDALLQIPADRYIALTDPESAEELKEYTERAGFELFVGSREDVLDRYVQACRTFGINSAVRATGDNPLVSGVVARRALTDHYMYESDYTGFLETPLGTGVEIVQAQALETAASETQNPYDREHVTPYIYRNPWKFSVRRIAAPEEIRFPFGSVTMDTNEDYLYIKGIFESLYRGKPIPYHRLVNYLRKETVSSADIRVQ
ncbi:MAG: acylneuraminate cytidylyltransferase [Spirochaetales bacterium]|nr:acylneuraminate cytidylyltransferase [Spirochaetales bacterium]